MKSLLFSVCILLISTNFIHSNINETKENLKPGLYRVYKELVNNSPSRKLTYSLVTNFEKVDNITIESRSLDVCKKESKSLGKIIGFSDGENVYLSTESQKISSDSRYSKTEDLGKYYYFVIKQLNPMLVSGSTIITENAVECLVKKSDGELIILDRRKLKKIISDDKELLNKFSREKKKDNKLKAYLLEYLNK